MDFIFSKSLHLCAGAQQGKDGCKVNSKDSVRQDADDIIDNLSQGDSGGPLLSREDSVSPFMVTGVVSTGTKDCGIGAPGVFTRVSNYYQWIIDTMQQ